MGLGVKIKLLNVEKASGKNFNIMHSKFLIIDDKYVILGSNNWTKSSIYENREISIFCTYKQVVSPLIKKFNKDWNSRYSGQIK